MLSIGPSIGAMTGTPQAYASATARVNYPPLKRRASYA